MTTADYIKIAIAVLSMLSAILPIVAHLNYISKSNARTKVVQIAQEIVAQIEATLQANPNANLAGLLQAGVTELKTVADGEITRMGLPASAIDGELMLLLQRYGSMLPGIAGRLVGEIVADFGAPSVSGAMASVPLRRGMPFVRSVGPA